MKSHRPETRNHPAAPSCDGQGTADAAEEQTGDEEPTSPEPEKGSDLTSLEAEEGPEDEDLTYSEAVEGADV